TGTGYGNELSFYTLAAVPTAPTVNNATIYNLTVTLNADANPAATTYAIYEAETEQYVQADGTLSATAVWQTAADWGSIIVTGLTPETEYGFTVRARNGANVETANGDLTVASTLAITDPLIEVDPIAAFGSL